MSLVLLQPTANSEGTAHYRQTIEMPVLATEWRPLVTPEVAEKLQSSFPGGSVPFWGVTEGDKGRNRTKWQRISSGDLVLFARDGAYFSSGIVALPFENEALAERLWKRNVDGDTWKFMYAIDELREVAIPYTELNPVMGYEDAYVPQGFNVLDAEKSMRVIDYLNAGSLKWQVAPPSSELDAAFATEGPLDLVTPGKRRVEQQALRWHLLPNSTGTCALCGREFAKQFLRAAHIKPRAACNETERRDLAHVAMPACVFGCDALFEQGYVTVGVGGEILTSPQALNTRGISGYIERHLTGVQAQLDFSGRAEYFAWHQTHRFRT